jgi:DNA-binding transcriptional LysR family regulator
MELRHLRYFIAAAEAENVSRAALKMRVSQPALSRQIRDLEDELGFLLFQRDGKSVRLTEAGREFLAGAREVIDAAKKAVEKARAAAAQSRIELHVGYAPSLTARFLPGALRAFQARSPGARVRLHDLSTGEMLSGLRERKLQIAFVVRSPAMLRGLRFEELAREPFCVATAPNNPLANRKTLSLADIADQPLIAYSRKDYPDAREHLEALFATVKKKPKIAEEHDSVSSLIAGVEAGAGIAVATESLACTSGPRLKIIPLRPAPTPLTVGAAWMEGGLEPGGLEFLKCAREAAAAVAR